MGSEEHGDARRRTWAADHEADMEEEMVEMSYGRKTREETEDGREAEDKEEDGAVSIEKAFEGKQVPTWREQLTFRALVVSFFLSVMLNIIVMKFNLTTGVIPFLNVAAGLLGFFFVKTWTKALEKTGLLRVPFTRQENTVIQTCCVAASGIAFSGGFGNYLFAMSRRIATQATEANNAQNIKDPEIGWMIGLLFAVSFLGLFSLVPLRKVMIIDYKLTYPSGTATAFLINGFHTPQGAKLAKKQVKTLGKFFAFSFLWGFFQWFYRPKDDCGFAAFPTLGLKAYENKIFFDFSTAYVGAGMICPHIVNISILLGAILSWGIMWPLIGKKEGSWYPTNLATSDLHGLQGYRVFIAVALILGDGLYNFIKVVSRVIFSFISNMRSKGSTSAPVSDNDPPLSTTTNTTISFDDKRRTEAFLKDQIPTSLAYGGYVAIAAVSITTLPHIFPQLKWYYVLVAYIFAPVLGFCNAYGCGLTDWSLASAYGKLAIFTIGAWAGSSNGSVLAGLAACGVMMSIVTTASDLMQDFKAGYLTLASPRSMFVSQVIGTAMGCVIAPCVFLLFYKAFSDLGLPGSDYPVPYASVYRGVAILSVDGVSSLPKHCLTFCYIFFATAILINLARDFFGKKVARFMPIPMAMAITFYIGAYVAIDMCVGSLILFVWEMISKAQADAFGPAVASGLICGDGIWTLPESLLALARVKPPICMKFLSRRMNDKVDDFIAKLS